MTSGFKKIIIIIFIVFAVLLSLAASVVFFPKERNKNILNQNNQQRNYQLSDSDNKPEELTKEERVKIMAKNFATIYETYRLGDFSNIEILKDKMTDRLWEEKARWIEIKKEELKNQPKRYITFSAHSRKADIISLDNNEAEITIDCAQTETKGATIQGEITIKFVNELGEEKPAPPPITINKKIILRLVKVNNEWKVDKIE